jgi:hypothetical protein
MLEKERYEDEELEFEEQEMAKEKEAQERGETYVKKTLPEKKSEKVFLRTIHPLPTPFSKEEERAREREKERMRTQSARGSQKPKVRLEDIGELQPDGSRILNYEVLIALSTSISFHISVLSLLVSWRWYGLFRTFRILILSLLLFCQSFTSRMRVYVVILLQFSSLPRNGGKQITVENE